MPPVASTLSSQFGNYGPQLCTDSNPSTICCTQNDLAPWIALEFATQVMVTKVQLLNRNVAGDRLENVEVRLTNSVPGSGATMFTGGELLGTFAGPGTNAQVVDVEGQATGKFVLVQMDNHNYLNLAEVKVFGEEAPSGIEAKIF